MVLMSFFPQYCAVSTDAPEVIDRRVAKAEFELTKAQGFDHIVLNDRLDEAIEETACILENFIGIQR